MTMDSAVPAFANDEPQPQPQQLARVPWGAVALFTVLACGLAWLVALPLWRIDLSDPANQTLGVQLMAQGLAVATMFTPAIAMLVVVFLAKTPRGQRARFLGVWPLRPAKRVVWFIALGVALPIAVVFVSLVVAASCGWLTLDLTNFSAFAASLGDASLGGMSVQMLVAVQLLIIPVGAVLNVLPAFGEEIGWRGWLLPALRPLGTWPALLLSGAIWGLWHSPLTLLGHNFGLYDWRGVALMTVGCVFWGVLLGWLRLRSGSVWPAVLAHGAINAGAGVFGLVAMADAPLSLALVNPLGVAGWIAVAAVVAILLVTRQFGKEPGLAPPRTQN